MVFFGSLLFAIFFLLKGGWSPKIPLKFRGGDMLVRFSQGGICLFLVVGFFFPKILGFLSAPGHEAGIYALAVSDRLVASGSKVGWWWFGGPMAFGRMEFWVFSFLHFSVFFLGFLGGGRWKKNTKRIFWWKDECSSFFCWGYHVRMIWPKGQRKKMINSSF